MDHWLMMSPEERRKKKLRRKNVSRKIRTVRLDNRHYRRGSTEEYPSVPDTVGVAPRVESPRYTGTLYVRRNLVQCTNQMRYQL